MRRNSRKQQTRKANCDTMACRKFVLDKTGGHKVPLSMPISIFQNLPQAEVMLPDTARGQTRPVCLWAMLINRFPTLLTDFAQVKKKLTASKIVSFPFSKRFPARRQPISAVLSLRTVFAAEILATCQPKRIFIFVATHKTFAI